MRTERRCPMRTLGAKFVCAIVVAVVLLALGSLSGCTVVTGSEGSLYVHEYELWSPYRAAYYQPSYRVTHDYNVNLTGAGRLGSDHWRDGWSHGGYGHGGWSGHGWSGHNPRGGRFGDDCR